MGKMKIGIAVKQLLAGKGCMAARVGIWPKVNIQMSEGIGAVVVVLCGYVGMQYVLVVIEAGMDDVVGPLLKIINWPAAMGSKDLQKE